MHGRRCDMEAIARISPGCPELDAMVLHWLGHRSVPAMVLKKNGI